MAEHTVSVRVEVKIDVADEHLDRTRYLLAQQAKTAMSHNGAVTEVTHAATVLRRDRSRRCTHGTPVGWTCEGCQGPARP